MEDDYEETFICVLFGKVKKVNHLINNVTIGPNSINNLSLNEKSPLPATSRSPNNVEKVTPELVVEDVIPTNQFLKLLDLQTQEEVVSAVNERRSLFDEFDKIQEEQSKQSWLHTQQTFINDMERQQMYITEASKQYDLQQVSQREKMNNLIQHTVRKIKETQESLREKERERKLILELRNKFILNIRRFAKEVRRINDFLKSLPNCEELIQCKALKFDSLHDMSSAIEPLFNKVSDSDDAPAITETDIQESEELVARIIEYKNNFVLVLKALAEKEKEAEAEKENKQEESSTIGPEPLAPQAAAVPVPVTAAIPVPVTAAVPVPVTAAVPIPVTTAVPIPVTTAAPIPVTTTVPIPVATTTEKANEETQKSTSAADLTKLAKYVSIKDLQRYTELMSFYDEHKKTFIQLENDQSLKKFKFDLKKAINIPVNSLSGVNSEHVLDKYRMLHRLLTGQSVIVSDKEVNAMRHPQGIPFCMDLLAKKFVLQGDLIVSSNPESAFCYATIMLSLWNDFPDFGKLLLVHFYKMCPYLVPYYIPRQLGESDEEFYVKMGYQYNDGEVEKQDKFLNRTTGIMKLYFTMMIVKPRRSQSVHPFNIRHGWKWLASFLKLEPQIDISATAVYVFLETVSFEMHARYKGMFLKVLSLVIKDFLPKCKDAKCTGGAVTRLELLLNGYLDAGRMEKPYGYEEYHQEYSRW